MSKILIISSFDHPEVTETVFSSATAVLEPSDVEYDKVDVSLITEIPSALSIALTSKKYNYSGCVIIGCVIHETMGYHNFVVFETARVIMDLIVSSKLAFGNGILISTSNTKAVLSAPSRGESAAKSALELIKFREEGASSYSLEGFN